MQQCVPSLYVSTETYSTALVQRCKYVGVAHVVAAYGPRVYSHDTQFASNLQVFNNSFTAMYTLD